MDTFEEKHDDLNCNQRKSVDTNGIISRRSLEKTQLIERPEEKREQDAMADHHLKHRARLRSPWSCSFLPFLCTAIAFIILATIVQSFLSRQLDPKGCGMPMMAPGYAKFDDFDTEYTRFASKYSLHLYRETSVNQDTRVILHLIGLGSYTDQ